MKNFFGKRIASLFSRNVMDESFFEELEDTLIEGDLGTQITFDLSEHIRRIVKKQRLDQSGMLLEMKALLEPYVSTIDLSIPKQDTPMIFLVLGVNGVGKTTSIAKMSHWYQKQGYTTVLSAADTFRAAAIDQLSLHAQRLGTRIVKQSPGSDPGAVIFDSIDSAIARKEQLILADTAGRMHTKEHLLRELQKIDKIVAAKLPGANYKKILVIDATTGQNGVRQAELFHETVGLDAIVLTKYDSASKGGSIIQIGKNLHIPIAFVGVGEGYDDIMPFDRDTFLNTLIGLE
ncbi:MAG: signal recognition particle-docking protein FtsY [Spirochaetia bacterium]|nr:signal recognition particle-docking protein FtsY [Spirochaetia bacterium]MCF7940463.1 signal recognition particle-docking protein FtsY [Spirochaetia bacterium]